MSTPVQPLSSGPLRPTPLEAELLARGLLAHQGKRWPHTQAVIEVAKKLTRLFDDEESALLLVAATLHDIGYSPRIRQTGFHPMDGALYLRSQGFPERLVCLVAHHSCALMTAPVHGIADLDEQFPVEHSLLSDALAYADMFAAPDGRIINPEDRLEDIMTRHEDPLQEDRAEHLRAAIARVSAALEESRRRAAQGDSL